MKYNIEYDGSHDDGTKFYKWIDPITNGKCGISSNALRCYKEEHSLDMTDIEALEHHLERRYREV